MTQIRFYLDEDTLNAALIRALVNAELDIATAADANKLGEPDEAQLLWATSQNRVIYSFNIGDFCRLRRDLMEQGGSHAGIVLAAQQQYSIGQQLRGLLKLAANTSAEAMVNRLVFLISYLN